eukprot:gene5468-5524_t
MIRFLATRSAGALVTLLVKSFIIFALIGLMPGDPLDMLSQANPEATPQEIANLREIYGVDQPLGARYWAWLGQAVQGDFGYSRMQHRPVMDIIVAGLGNTLVLMGIAFVISTIIAIFLGTIAATRRGSWLDRAINMLAYAGISVPSFWLALVLIYIFAVRLGWLPAGGMPHQGDGAQGWAALLGLAVLICLIALCLSAPLFERWLEVSASETDLLSRFDPPQGNHWLGSDDAGRDEFVRLLAGGWTSLSIGLLGALGSSFVGTIIGAVAGYARGKTDMILMRITDGIIALPTLPLLIILAALDLSKLGFKPTPETMTQAQREAVAEATAGVRGRIPGPMRAWIHSPTMASRAQLLGAFLRYDTSLAPAISEFAILLTARNAACSYVWHAHAKEALLGGLDPVIIDDLAAGRPLTLSDPTLRIVHDYVSALLATHRVPQALHDEAVAVLGETGVVELVGVMGYYSLVAMTVNAFAFDLQPGAQPIFD